LVGKIHPLHGQARVLRKGITMRRVVLLLASMAAALLLVSGAAMFAPNEQARAAFPGENGKITFLDRAPNSDNEIYTISLSGGKWGNAKPLTDNDKSDKTPSFSPNGKKIVWESGEYLYLMNADGSNKRRIPDTRHSNLEIGRYGSYGGNPAFSKNLPGGNKIIFDKNQNIFTINPDGTGLDRITNAAPGGDCLQTPTFVHPVWSPVNDKIAFSYLCGKNNRELHVMPLSDLRGKQNLDNTSRLSPAGVDVYRPDWSPDGTKIVYECSEEPCQSGTPHSPSPDIYIVDLNGNNTPLVTNGADDSYPVFSPSGGKVAFSSDRTTGPGVNNPGADDELFIKNADGSGDPKQITFNGKMDIQPDWQPIR
jgi:Tol biopolymer transport system component